MQPFSVPILPARPRIRPRTALVASADRSFRQRLTQILTSLRWEVREVEGGAAAWSEAEAAHPEAVIVDSWLPDLDLSEFLSDFRGRFPGVDVVTAEGSSAEESPRGPYRQELLYALRRSQESDTAVWNAAPAMDASRTVLELPKLELPKTDLPEPVHPAESAATDFAARQAAPTAPSLAASAAKTVSIRAELPPSAAGAGSAERLPEMVGNSSCMLEVSRRVRLVAPRMTPVLIEGPTGSGKELVAEALHRLSSRNRKAFVAINCAAIPESLLEAELFGHTRGAFTGAVQGRTGRIEAADGGTLFLDEIGEMPLGLQSKLLRFVECGELQRVGDNETVKVDVRIVAATHRPLDKHTQEGLFRSDLYYRLAVFLIRTPALADHLEDLPALVSHFLERMGRTEPVKRINAGAMAQLGEHTWPGNVRELEHVLERAAILAGENVEITTDELDFGESAE